MRPDVTGSSKNSNVKGLWSMLPVRTLRRMEPSAETVEPPARIDMMKLDVPYTMSEAIEAFKRAAATHVGVLPPSRLLLLMKCQRLKGPPKQFDKMVRSATLCSGEVCARRIRPVYRSYDESSIRHKKSKSATSTSPQICFRSLLISTFTGSLILTCNGPDSQQHRPFSLGELSASSRYLDHDGQVLL